MNSIHLGLALAVLLGAVAAGPGHAGYSAASDPSSAQIYLAAASNLPQARQMIRQVIEHHPESAKAHWIAAVLDARSDDDLGGNRELARAERLAPGLPFVSSHALADLRRQLTTTRVAVAARR